MSDQTRKSESEPLDPPVAESWSRTELYKVKGRHQWTIDDFLLRVKCGEVGKSLLSPKFGVPVYSQPGKVVELMFHLEVFPNGEEKDDSDYVSIFVISHRPVDFDIKFDFSVLKADNTQWGQIGDTRKFSPHQKTWGYNKAFLKAQLIENQAECLPSGRLTIVCSLEVYHSDRTMQGKKSWIDSLHAPETVGQTLADSMGAAFLSREFSDVTVVCEGRKFPCHKLVLSARSDVFKAMFSHEGTREDETNRVVIEDTDSDTLEQLLKFIYTDKVDCDMSQLAGSLMQAADKYNIPRLKSLCEDAICNSIEVSNAADALVLAHLHEASNLKAVALKFVTTHMNKVADTPGWSTITESHPRVLSEILKIVMAGKDEEAIGRLESVIVQHETSRGVIYVPKTGNP